MVVAIQTSIKEMPEYCDDCQWYSTRPHPYKGWTEICELMGQCMDDDGPEEWVYDGNGRPKACPLIEVGEKQIPKKARYNEELDRYYCPICGASVDWDGMADCQAYCDECGQKISREEEENERN